MIRVDLHVHTKISKGFPFRMSDFDRTVNQALKGGLQGFAAIEHFHARSFWETIDALGKRYAYSDGRFAIKPGFDVLSGAELTVADKADIVLLGPVDALVQFDRHFCPRLSEGNHPYLSEILEPAKQAGLLAIGAHPTRPGKNFLGIDEDLVRRLDAFEVNGKDVAKEQAERRVKGWARDLSLPTVGGSDTHVWAQVGVQRTLLPGRELTFSRLRDAIRTGRTSVETVPNIPSIVRMCEMYKKLWKRSMLAGQEPAPLLRTEPVWLSAHQITFAA